MDPEKIAGVRYWSSHLAFESTWNDLYYEWYVWPAAVRKILNKLRTGSGYLIAIFWASRSWKEQRSRSYPSQIDKTKGECQ